MGDIGIGKVVEHTRFHNGVLNGNAVRVLVGDLDDLRIYNAALKPADVHGLFGRQTSSPILHLRPRRQPPDSDERCASDELRLQRSQSVADRQRSGRNHGLRLRPQRQPRHQGRPGTPGATDRTDYHYDVANRPVSADVDGSVAFAATYDGRTRRQSKTESQAPGPGGDTTTFRYGGGTSFQERKSAT